MAFNTETVERMEPNAAVAVQVADRRRERRQRKEAEAVERARRDQGIDGDSSDSEDSEIALDMNVLVDNPAFVVATRLVATMESLSGGERRRRLSALSRASLQVTDPDIGN